MQHPSDLYRTIAADTLTTARERAASRRLRRSLRSSGPTRATRRVPIAIARRRAVTG